MARKQRGSFGSCKNDSGGQPKRVVCDDADLQQHVSMRAQLAVLGLQVRQIPGDGYLFKLLLFTHNDTIKLPSQSESSGSNSLCPQT